MTIFDLKTLKTLTTVPIGKNPDAIIYDAASKRVFAFNSGRPAFAAADEKGMVYVNLEGKNEAIPIDSGQLKAKAH